MAANKSNVVPFATRTPLDPEQKLEMLRRASPGVLAQAYLNYREQRDTLREEMKRLHQQMELIAGVIQEKLTQLDQDGFNTKDYTVYRQVRETVRVTDPQALREYILSDPEANLDLIDMRGSIDGVRNHMAQRCVLDKDGYDITPYPEGVEIVQHNTLGVRKK